MEEWDKRPRLTSCFSIFVQLSRAKINANLSCFAQPHDVIGAFVSNEVLSSDKGDGTGITLHRLCVYLKSA
jgi:hypothetical protein